MKRSSWLQVCDDSSDTSDGPLEPETKRARRSSTAKRTVGGLGEARSISRHFSPTSAIAESERISEEVGSSYRQTSNAFSNEAIGVASPLTSPVTVFPSAVIWTSRSDRYRDAVCHSKSKRKRSACRQVLEDSSEDSDSSCGRSRKRVRRTARSGKTNISSDVEITAYRQPWDAVSNEAGGSASRSTSRETDLPVSHIPISSSDGDTDSASAFKRKRSACRQVPEDSSEDSDSSCGRSRKRVRRTATSDKTNISSEEVRGPSSPSTSAEATLPAAYMSVRSSSGDTDTEWLSTRRIKRPAYRRDRYSSSCSSDDTCERSRKYTDRTSIYVETEKRPEEARISCLQPCHSSTCEVRPAASPEAVLPGAYIYESSSDGNTEVVCSLDRRRKKKRWDYPGDSDSSQSPPEPHTKVAGRALGYGESQSGAINCLLQTPEANLHRNFRSSRRGYEKRVAVDEVEGVSGQVSAHNFGSRSGENTNWEISMYIQSSEETEICRPHPSATSTTEERDERSEEVENLSGQDGDDPTIEEREGISAVVGADSRHPCDSSTADVCEEALQTSPKTVKLARVKSDDSSDRDLEKCPICLSTFGAQEVGIPDCCDHIFCTGCLEQWSANSNTCPVDRQEFNGIFVRYYPDGEVIGRIPVTPRRFEIEEEDLFEEDQFFCMLCGENNGDDHMFNCEGCGFFYHSQCIISAFQTLELEEWACPFCFAISGLESD